MVWSIQVGFSHVGRTERQLEQRARVHAYGSKCEVGPKEVQG